MIRAAALAAPLLLAAFTAAGGAAQAQQAPTDPAASALLAEAVLGSTPAAALAVTSPAFAPGSDIPAANTRYGENRAPGLAWTAGPPSTRGYAVIVQDPDSLKDGLPILHWTVYDVPASVTRLEPGAVAPPAGAQAGPNVRGPAQPYAGPHPPAGLPHRYHFQVFALDAAIPPDPAMTYPQLLTAMRGHVVAEGGLIGLARKPADAADAPPSPSLAVVPPKPKD